MSPKAQMTPEQAVTINQPEFRAEAQAARESLVRERREGQGLATSDALTQPDDAVALAKFIGALRRIREEAGLTLEDIAGRSGVDKAILSRLENGLFPDPTINLLAGYARAVGKRFVPAFEV